MIILTSALAIALAYWIFSSKAEPETRKSVVRVRADERKTRSTRIIND